MKCIILAAGYATRLYPLTENFPKPLLEVDGHPILDHLIADVDRCGLISQYAVVSNHRFAGHFQAWARSRQTRVRVLDDGTTSNATRLGAVRDMLLAVEHLDLQEEDCLVMAGDNLLDFSLCRFVEYALEKGTSAIMRYWEPLRERLGKCGVVTVDEADRITSMEEKPSRPASQWCCPPFYFYRRQDLGRIAEAIADGCGVDAPGSLMAWMSRKTPVHAMEMPGRRYDIGTLETYRDICAHYHAPSDLRF